VHCTHQGKGEAILFIHGMPTNHRLWDGVIARLSESHQCFAIDLPGMGETPFAPYRSDYLDRMAKQIEQLRMQHGVKKWHVVGHDAGSAIAVHYAGSFAKNVGCLALLSPAVFPDLKPFYLLNPLRKRLLGEVLAPLLLLLFWQIAMRRAIAGQANRALRRAFYKPFSGRAGAWKFMRLVRWGKPEDMLAGIPATLAQLPMPTLVFRGSHDVLPAAFADRAASLIPRSDMVTLDAGHFIPLERPREVAASLAEFFFRNSAEAPVAPQDRKLRSRKALTPRTGRARLQDAEACRPVSAVT
jgi:pimeloyl-ACP methyl ester carboxylesterase